MKKYYSSRAPEYEKIYRKPERQKDLKEVIAFLKDHLSEEKVLEIACGTGFWTQHVSSTAASVLATDISWEMIEIARTKTYPLRNVKFVAADFRNLPFNNTGCSSLFGGFIWSHIPRQSLDAFLRKLHLSLPDANCVFIDNRYVEGSSTEISETDQFGNTCQIRKLSNGTSYKIIKNFPDNEFLTDKIRNHGGCNIELKLLKYYWILKYKKQD